MVTFNRRGGTSSGGERQLFSIQKIFIILAIILVSLFLCALRLRSSLAEQYSVSSNPKDNSVSSNPKAIPKNKIVTSTRNSSGDSDKPIQVAYAISLIKCSDKQSSTSGLIDTATVLRHSVHQTSMRNPSSGSKYDYKMYAIVHKKAESCSQPRRSGCVFEVVMPGGGRWEVKYFVRRLRLICSSGWICRS